MSELSPLRLNLLRGGYALIAIAMGIQIWPQILNPEMNWELQRSVVVSMLGAMTLLSLIGLRSPLRMLPLLLFEVTWKVIWMVRVAVPLWIEGKLDPAAIAVAWACAFVVLIIAVIPWDYVVKHFVLMAGDPWVRHQSASAPGQAG